MTHNFGFNSGVCEAVIPPPAPAIAVSAETLHASKYGPAGAGLIFDAGTGIIALGKELCDGAVAAPSAYIFLSHTHIDHVMGLCFFEPLLTPKARTFILGPG